MFKKVFILFLIVAITLGLKQHKASHRAVEKKVHITAFKYSSHLTSSLSHFGPILPKEFAQHFSAVNGVKTNHLRAHRQQNLSAVQKDQADRLANFIMNDKDLFETIKNGEDFNLEQNKKILNWMLNDPQYSQALLNDIATSGGNEWMNDLSPNAQKRALKITLNAMIQQQGFDLANPQLPSAQTMTKIFQQFLNDPEIGDYLLSQIPWDELGQEDIEWISVAIGKQIDPENLTRGQKVEIYLAILESFVYQ